MAGHFVLFDTPVGRCAIAWTVHGIAGLQLPEADEGALRAAVARKHAEFTETKPTPSVMAAINSICALLSGERPALAEITLDTDGLPPFHCRVPGNHPKNALRSAGLQPARASRSEYA